MIALNWNKSSDGMTSARVDVAECIIVPTLYSLSSSRIIHPHSLPSIFVVPSYYWDDCISPSLGSRFKRTLLWLDISKCNVNQGLKSICVIESSFLASTLTWEEHARPALWSVPRRRITDVWIKSNPASQIDCRSVHWIKLVEISRGSEFGWDSAKCRLEWTNPRLPANLWAN